MIENPPLIMFTKHGWYTVESSGKKPLIEEAADHGVLNPHITHIEDIEGTKLWIRQ